MTTINTFDDTRDMITQPSENATEKTTQPTQEHLSLTIYDFDDKGCPSDEQVKILQEMEKKYPKQS